MFSPSSGLDVRIRKGATLPEDRFGSVQSLEEKTATFEGSLTVVVSKKIKGSGLCSPLITSFYAFRWVAGFSPKILF